LKAAVPLISHNVTKLKFCHYQIVGSPETKTIGVHATIPIGTVNPQLVIGFKRDHVEKIILHMGRNEALTIVSEDELKRRGITVI
jgi:hypothetical protein